MSPAPRELARLGAIEVADLLHAVTIALGEAYTSDRNLERRLELLYRKLQGAAELTDYGFVILEDAS